MKPKFTIFDFNTDWALKENFGTPRSIPGYLTHEEAFAFYASLGVEGVELSRLYWEKHPTSYLKKITVDAGLPVFSYIFYQDLTLPTPEQRRASIDDGRRQLDRTAELGGQLAMIIPNVYKKGIPLEDQRGWLIDGLRACAEHAQSLDILVCVENIDDPPCRPMTSRAEDCRSLCEAVDSPSCRLIYDPGCTLFLEEDPVQVLRTMAPYVVHVHMKNSRPLYQHECVRRSWPTVGGRVLTGTVIDGGLANIPAVLAELKQMNYDGHFMIEYLGENDPRIAVPYNIDYLRRQIQGD